MPPAAFTIKLGEGQNRVSIETLTEALESAIKMLAGVGEEFTPSGVVVRWELVAASLKSPVALTFKPRVQGSPPRANTIGPRIAAACVRGMAQLERKAVQPAHFNEDALLAAERLVKVAQKDGRR
jgi:hypothetical protein